MCGRLNQFASLPELAIAGRLLRIERLKPLEREDAIANVAIVKNICPTDYADVLREAYGHLQAVRMRFGLVLFCPPEAYIIGWNETNRWG